MCHTQKWIIIVFCWKHTLQNGWLSLGHRYQKCMSALAAEYKVNVKVLPLFFSEQKTISRAIRSRIFFSNVLLTERLSYLIKYDRNYIFIIAFSWLFCKIDIKTLQIMLSCFTGYLSDSQVGIIILELPSILIHPVWVNQLHTSL